MTTNIRMPRLVVVVRPEVGIAGLPDILIAYMAKILIKKWPERLFFEKVTAKITNCFNYGNFHIHRSQIVQKAAYCSLKKCGFAKEASFYPKTTISAVNLKLPVTTCLHLS